MLSQQTIEKRWKQAIKGGNVITPEVIRIDQSNSERYIYEFSKGEDFSGKTCYGVTVVELGGYGRRDEHIHDMSKFFTGPKAYYQATKYIKGL